jgi:hypothetical protein
LIEHQQELATFRASTLNGMRKTCRKEPQISLGDVIKEHGAIGIHH